MEKKITDFIRKSINEALINHHPNGVANISQALHFAGYTSRSSLKKQEDEGLFPKRVILRSKADGTPSSVGWLWDDLYQWRDSLKKEVAEEERGRV